MARASITAGSGPFVFGQSYSREAVVADWQPKGGDKINHWARIDCRQGGDRVYAQYNSLESDTQTGFTFGPTPSWSGGPATCQLSLINIGTNRTLAKSAEFEAQG